MINKGSEWNIWDLHVHTPASIFHRFGNADDVWETYILDLENLSPNFKVIGINDYFFIDGYERLLKEQIENFDKTMEEYKTMQKEVENFNRNVHWSMRQYAGIGYFENRR